MFGSMDLNASPTVTGFPVVLESEKASPGSLKTMEEKTPAGQPIVDREKVCTFFTPVDFALPVPPRRHPFSYAHSSKLVHFTGFLNFKMALFLFLMSCRYSRGTYACPYPRTNSLHVRVAP